MKSQKHNSILPGRDGLTLKCIHCDTCGISMPIRAWNSHRLASEHTDKVQDGKHVGNSFCGAVTHDPQTGLPGSIP